ncbi:MAG: phosphodiester glycosidase family protein [Acidobacteria bacterium]|nr:phosphodiester glycosidase family protein [Acidobacteriota bacterium]
MEKRKMERISGSIAAFLLICCIGHAGERLDLYPGEPGALVAWTETRSDPRPLHACFLKISLDAKGLEVIALPGEDPDGPGPAESRLTQPADLFREFRALAAVNANAFAGVNGDGAAFPRWFEGQPVDMHGLVASRGITVSPVEGGRTPFWIDAGGNPHIGDPAGAGSALEAVSDWFSPLLVQSRIVPDASDTALHPRTALGFDDSGAWLLLVVVDGRQPGFSEGVTLYELAEMLQSEGCTESINLDGGGSSIMLIRESEGDAVRTLNSPSGGAHRPVPVMLGVRESKNQFPARISP